MFSALKFITPVPFQIAPAVNAGTITVMASANEGEPTHTHSLLPEG